MDLRGARIATVVVLGALTVDGLLFLLLIGPVPVEARNWFGGGGLLRPLLPFAVLAVAASRARRVEVERWLVAREVPADGESLTAAAAWLDLTRTARGIGFVLPLLAGSWLSWAVNAVPTGSSVQGRLVDLVTNWPLQGWGWGIAGYALGAAAAEWLRVRRWAVHDGPRRAVLRERSLAAYSAPLARVVPPVLALAALLLAAGSALAGLDPGPFAPSAPRLAALALTVGGGAEVLRRLVVARPQRVHDPARMAVDDAARATTVHAVSGSAIALLALAVGDHLQWLATEEASVPGWFGLAGALLGVVGIGVWLGHGVGLVHVLRRPDVPARDGRDVPA